MGTTYNLVCTVLILFASLLSRFIYPSRLMRLVAAGWTAISVRPWVAIVAVAALAALVCAGLSLRGWHYPGTHDEFGYLLTAETFTLGRLTNPTPTSWIHFESIHIIVQPSYTAKYPPGQSVFLALGWALFGHPMFGVYISFILACAAICWMLQAWLPPRWSFAGGVLAVLLFGTTDWANSYWGGAVAALGGALVFGSMRRLVKDQAVGSGIALGVGLAILANTRPYEGLVVSVLALLVLAGHAIANRTLWTPPFLLKVALPVVLVLAPTAAAMACYNHAVTGDALRMPYRVHDDTYAAAPTFLWQPPKSAPAYNHDAMRDYYVGHELPRYLQKCAHCGFDQSLGTKLYMFAKFYVTPLLVIPWGFMIWRIRDGWWRFALVTCAILLLALTQTLYLFPHYAAPATGLLVGLNVQAIRYCRQWKLFGARAGACYTAGIFGALGLGVILFCCQPEQVPPRGTIEARLAEIPGRHLVFVHYVEGHDAHDEWVYNSANLSSARVIWARELGASANEKLIAELSGRIVWIVTVGSPTAPSDLQRYDRTLVR